MAPRAWKEASVRWRVGALSGRPPVRTNAREGFHAASASCWRDGEEQGRRRERQEERDIRQLLMLFLSCSAGRIASGYSREQGGRPEFESSSSELGKSVSRRSSRRQARRPRTAYGKKTAGRSAAASRLKAQARKQFTRRRDGLRRSRTLPPSRVAGRAVASSLAMRSYKLAATSMRTLD